MLWSLALAAVCGAVAILVAEKEVVWRVVGTAIATAVASALMMATSLLMDHDKSRSAGTLGMVAVVVEYLLVLSLIWELGNYLSWVISLEDRLGFTILFIALTVLPAMLFLRLLPEPVMRVAMRVGLCLCGLVFLMLETACWGQQHLWRSGKMWASAAAVAGFGTLAVATLVGAGTDRRHWRYLGTLAAIAACAIVLFAIWHDLNEDSGLVTVVTSLAAVIAHANLIMFCPLRQEQRWVRHSTIACGILTAICVDINATWFAGQPSDLLLRLAGACGFIAGCGTLALAILARLNRGVGQKAILSEIKELTLICPGCGKKQTVAVGDSQCLACNLRFAIRVEEPRCISCGYLLYMLKSDTCPECGTSIIASPPPA